MHRCILGAESGFWSNISRMVHMYSLHSSPLPHTPGHSEVTLGLDLWGLSQAAWERPLSPAQGRETEAPG